MKYEHAEHDHILIVDDDANHVKTLQAIVRAWGYQVSTADDGTTAVEMVKERPFALILMDVRMAQMSGIEASSGSKHTTRPYPS